ncbi:2-polyprenyl-6-methoxyphenol hydroxylase-like FAD-dependent oxidoreductase [Pseudonocardia sediminis]|uniref:2-polyprenyl-6-methoxyphenol hydroxylase-like FAD-dependent oxidoreductase n=1 Tax=Pseudonocardia sediminis TaxID=1397368 RepID=A0A4Q7V078_PSEST|nr:FAD-dependent monooxygenase [Pseudonocardia sediminis]RZT87676.1 2-polyprenyl-6-methoxyphenol hydroxylase-like FAD-dependent oxidoreductase [Pseudonocardia sediminis]
MSAPTILISGASIAGPALAHWLNVQGWRTTIVERFDELRDEGQNIDVRGAGREVARRMGIEDAIRAATTGETGTEFVDGDGKRVAYFPAGESDSGGATAELEILRGQLSRIIVDRTRPDTEYVFGDQITALDERDDGVTVAFAHGPERTFDLVVVAEGLRSRTRALALPGVDAVRELGFYVAYTTIPRTAEDTDLWRWQSAGRGRSVTLRPDNRGTIRASLGFLADVRGLDELGRDDQITILRRTFADVGWVAPRVLDALGDAPLYFDAVGQTRLPAWSNGRTGLVGDAAYCSSPISGMSTSLALTGAYVLAGELATNPDHRTAFARYESVMRPYVDKAQKLPPGAPRIANPRSRAGLAVMNTVLRFAASPVAERLGALSSGLFSPPAEAIDLPTYPVPGAAALRP